MYGVIIVSNKDVVDVYIRYLRNKLKPYDRDKMIETVRGVGYVIR